MSEEFRIPEGVAQLADVRYEQMEAEVAEEVHRKLTEEQKRHAEMLRMRTEGLQYAEKIFEWALAFRSTSAGKKLIEVGHPTHAWNETGIFFFDGDVAEKGWRGLGIGKKGIWWHADGCSARPQYVDGPEMLAEQVDVAILQEAVAWIESGTVWLCIQRLFSE